MSFDTKPREDLFVKPKPTQAELIASAVWTISENGNMSEMLLKAKQKLK